MSTYLEVMLFFAVLIAISGTGYVLGRLASFWELGKDIEDEIRCLREEIYARETRDGHDQESL